jgi:hypothetical protein
MTISIVQCAPLFDFRRVPSRGAFAAALQRIAKTG